MTKTLWLGKELKKLRQSKKLTQRDVQEVLGYTTAQFISNWERGVSLPPLDAVPKLSKIFQVPSRSLLQLLFAQRERQLAAEKAFALAKWGKVRC